jgi:YD repeat-containing protein
VGLNSDPTGTDNYNTIDYAIYCRNDGRLMAYEGGQPVELSDPRPTYTANDTLRVVYDHSLKRVQYLQIAANGTQTVLRTKAVEITAALYLDSSFAADEAQITELKFGKAGLTTVMAAASESEVSIVGDTVEKIGGASGVFDTSVRSAVGYVGQANLSFSAGQADKSFYIGLSTDPANSSNGSSLDYAFFCRNNGVLEIREKDDTANRLSTTVYYTAQDELEIAYDGTTIRFLKNGTELWSEAASITSPLYLDSSFASIGARVTNLRFADRAKPEQTTRYVYAAANPDQLRYAISPEGRVTQYKYNSYGERVAQIGYTKNAYAVAGLADGEVPTEAQLDAWVTALGADLSQLSVRTGYAYDARGLLTNLNEYLGVNADGSGKDLRQTKYIYDQAGRLLQTIEEASGIAGDETGSPTTTTTYDGLGRVLTVTGPNGALTTTLYSDSTQKVTVTAQSGGISTSVYDKAGRLISLARTGGGLTEAKTTYAYDDAGRLLMSTDPTGMRSFALYDEAGRQVGSVDSDGTLTETTYDRAGRATRVYTYATAVNLGLLVDANGVALNPTLAAVRPSTDTADLQRWNVYDDAGRLAYEIGEDGAVTQHDYDGAGRLVRRVRYSVAIAVTASPSVSYVQAQLADTDVIAGAGADRAERFFYNADGHLSATLDAEGYLTRHTYDQAGRRVQTRRYATAVAEAARAGGGDLAKITPATHAKDQVDTFFYDGRGQLRGSVDAEGYLTRNFYTDRGQLADQTRYATPLAQQPAWTDDFDALVLAIRPGGAYARESEDRFTTWRYRLDGQLANTTNHEGTKTSYEYDSAGRLVKTTAGDGRADKRVGLARYDAWGRKTAELSAEGAAKITEGMTQAQIDAVWASDGVDYVYDRLDRLVRSTDANNNQTMYFYDGDGRLTHTVNPLGEVQENRYNTLGQLTATVRYGGARIGTSGIYGGLVNTTLTDRVAAIADPLKDSVTSYTYDGTGRLLTTTSAEGAQTSTYYNAFGEVRKQLVAWQSGANLNVDRREDTFAYDRRGQLLQTIQDATGSAPIAATTDTQYDAFGRATRVDSRGIVQSFSYDKLGRVLTSANAIDPARVMTYDAFGQVLTVKDELGKITEYAYDRAARKVTMTTPEGVSVTTVHTVYGQTYTVKDGKGTTTTYTYDLDGHLTQTKVGSLVVEDREYDAGGRLQATIDARGTRTTYTYDAANRMLTRTVEPTDADADVELNLQTKWEYDPKGQAWKVTDPRGTVTEYTFDLEGRTIKQVVDPTGLAIKTEWTHDAEGRVVTLLDPNSVTTQYTFDKLGRRTKEQLDPSGLNISRSFTYDEAGNALTATDARGKVTRYRYDSAGRLTYTADAAGSVTRNEYNAKGQLAKQTRYVDTVTSSEEPSNVLSGSGDWVTRYAYDDDGRLEYTIDALGGVTRHEYDGNGNVIKTTRYADTVTSSEAATAVQANSELDQVTRIEYDAFNRETWRADPMGSVTRNEYDAAGSLVRRTRYNDTVTASEAPSAAVASGSDRVERFIVDAAGRVTYAYDATNAVTLTSYDKNGNVTQVTRYANPSTSEDPADIQADAANDRVVTFHYNRANRRTWVVDELGYVTLNSYDDNGNVTSIRRYADKPESRSDPSSAVLNDTNDRVQGFEYDEANRLQKSTDALGGTEEFTYDGAGNKLTFKNKNGHTWTYTYDALGRLLTETSPEVSLYTIVESNGALNLSTAVSDPVITTLAYDSFGNIKSRTEATDLDEERTTSYAYDKLGRQIKVTFPQVDIYKAETTAQMETNGKTTDASRSETVDFEPTSQTWYDSFGNAVSSIDRNGNASFKAYDAAGRVKYEVDALGYITEYSRNAFGEATGQKRYFNADASLVAAAPSDADKGPTKDEIAAAIAAEEFATTSDRYLATAYDKAGRVVSVTEPSSYTYNSTNGRGVTYGKATVTVYNAFGEVARVAELIDVNTSTSPDTLTYQYTHHYHDQAGRRVATADAGGYLTKFEYDSEGNLTKQIDYATPMVAAATLDGYTLPAVSGTDRTTTWKWDKLNRRTSETKVGATYLNTGTLTTTFAENSTADLTTSYGYDAVGNLTRTTDAAGAITYTYYDALGRTRAVAAPSRTSTVDGAVLIPLIEFRRDAHGNVLAKIERANTATGVTEAGYSITANSTADRVTKTLYDASGNARQVHDAENFQRHNSYAADGKLAKTWQTVTDNDGAKTTLYTSYRYDKLGRLLNTYSSSAVAGQSLSNNHEYNAFGELIRRGQLGGWQEYFAYDNAGRLWKTNSGDGNAKVFLYDLMGRQTAEISSAGSGRSGSVDVGTATSASQAAGWTSTRRINIKYDALGHVTQREEAVRLTVEGGITVRQATANTQITARSMPWADDNDTYVTFNGNNPNSVALTWSTLGFLGSGEVKVQLAYLTKDTTDNIQGKIGSPSALAMREFVYQDGLADAGTTVSWYDTQGSRAGGIERVTSLVVYKKDINGEWVEVINRNPDQGRQFGTWGTQVEIGAPVDASASVTFKYRASGTGTYTSVSDANLVKFGDSYWFKTDGLAEGSYDYEVWVTDHHLSVDTDQDGDDELLQSESYDAARRTETGSFTTRTNDIDDQAPTENWMRPTQTFVVDRWGNVLERNDPRQATWKTVYTYNRDNQVTSEKRPDALYGNQGTSSPLRTIYYDKLGRQRAVQDERGYVNTQEWDAGGNLTREVHADGGKVTYFYDAFGQKVRMVDALGNTTSDKNSELYTSHTTVYAYDKLGRHLSTTHGTTAGGSVNVWGMTTDMIRTGGAKQNLVEVFTYDEAGRKLSQTNGATQKTQYWYDRAGNVVKTRQPGGQSSTASYNAQNRKISEIDANGNTATWFYDYFGQLQDHVDIGGANYDYEYDSARQLIKQTNTRGQNLNYGFDAAGQLVNVFDDALDQTTWYAYDLAGRRIRERVQRSVAGLNGAPTTIDTLQDNHLAYDTNGRLIYSADNRVQLTFEYDKAGNRTRILTHTLVRTQAGYDVDFDADRHFRYDAMNRQTLVDGIDTLGNIGVGQGHKITYDVNGNRKTDTFHGNKVNVTNLTYTYTNDESGETVTYTGSPTYDTVENAQVTETYSYDALGRLLLTDRDGMLVDHRYYDGAGRVVQSGPDSLPNGYAEALNDGVADDKKIGMDVRRMRYDANGRLLFQKVLQADGTGTKHHIVYEGIGRNNTTLGYDASGNVLAYEFRNLEGTDYTNTVKLTLERYESYVEKKNETDTNSQALEDGTTSSMYDVNGHLVGIDDYTERSLDRQILNDSAGRALRVTQAGNRLYSLMVNGELLGQHGMAPNELDPRTKTGVVNFKEKAEFEFGYKSITGSYPAPSVGAYTVRQGDSLQAIAQAAFGDSSQWWRIAQANGLQGDRDLRVGQTLSMPAAIAGNTNTSGTFKPYNPTEVVGDTSPNLPQAKAANEGCGTLGTIIMIVVAAVVTYYTAGLAGGGVWGGLVGGAAGSVASQAVGIAIGAQEVFSWQQVAMSAIGGAVGAGVTQVANEIGNAVLKHVIVKAAISNALTQGIGVAVGAQEHFSWKGVAAAAVGAGVGQAVNTTLLGDQLANGNWKMDTTFADALGKGTAAKFASGLLAGLASGATVQAMRGGKVNMQQVAADAFGNALGQGLVDAMSSDQTGANARSDLNKFNRENDEYYNSPAPLPTDPPSRDWFAGSSLRLGESGRGPRLGTGSIEPPPTPEELQAAFRQSERDYRSRTEQSVAGVGRVAQAGDGISTLLGTSNPQAIGNFIIANGLDSSNLEAGRNYFVSDDIKAYGEATALGQAALDGDNRRLDLAAANKVNGLTRYSQAQREADPNYRLVSESNARIASYRTPEYVAPLKSNYSGLEIAAALSGETAPLMLLVDPDVPPEIAAGHVGIAGKVATPVAKFIVEDQQLKVSGAAYVFFGGNIEGTLDFNIVKGDYRISEIEAGFGVGFGGRFGARFEPFKSSGETTGGFEWSQDWFGKEQADGTSAISLKFVGEGQLGPVVVGAEVKAGLQSPLGGGQPEAYAVGQSKEKLVAGWGWGWAVGADIINFDYKRADGK